MAWCVLFVAWAFVFREPAALVIKKILVFQPLTCQNSRAYLLQGALVFLNAKFVQPVYVRHNFVNGAAVQGGSCRHALVLVSAPYANGAEHAVYKSSHN